MKQGSLVLLLACLSISASADVLLVDSIKSLPPNNEQGLPRPVTGNSMSQVSARFGEPDSTRDAVGEPPITRWVYPGYTVYFEHEHVVNVVVHR